MVNISTCLHLKEKDVDGRCRARSVSYRHSNRWPDSMWSFFIYLSGLYGQVSALHTDSSVAITAHA